MHEGLERSAGGQGGDVPALLVVADVPVRPISQRALLITDRSYECDNVWLDVLPLPPVSPFARHKGGGCTCCRSALSEMLGQMARGLLLGEGVAFDTVVVAVTESVIPLLLAELRADMLVRARYRLIEPSS